MADEKQSQKGLIVVALLLAAGLTFGCLRLAGVDKVSLPSGSPEEKFMTAWKDDLEKLSTLKKLPVGFYDLKSIKLIATSERLKAMYHDFPLGIKTQEKGHYELEIFLDQIDDDGGMVVQYDLINIKTGNTIWEQGRTFPQKLGLTKEEKVAAAKQEVKDGAAKDAAKNQPAASPGSAPVNSAADMAAPAK